MSRAILDQLAHIEPGGAGPAKINLDGMPWQKAGHVGRLTPDALTAKVLCRRHNTALAPLDASAADTFRTFGEAFDYVGASSLSVRTRYLMVDGEALELWGLKTLLGTYQARIASEDRVPVKGMREFELKQSVGALSGGRVPPPLGLYFRPLEAAVQRHAVEIGPLLSEVGAKVLGLSVTMHGGLCFNVMADATGVEQTLRSNADWYRPTILDVRGPRRSARIVLAWREMGPTRVRVEIITG